MTEPKRPMLIEQIQQAEMARRLERLRRHMVTAASLAPRTRAVYDALVQRLARKDNTA